MEGKNLDWLQEKSPGDVQRGRERIISTRQVETKGETAGNILQLFNKSPMKSVDTEKMSKKIPSKVQQLLTYFSGLVNAAAIRQRNSLFISDHDRPLREADRGLAEINAGI